MKTKIFFLFLLLLINLSTAVNLPENLQLAVNQTITNSEKISFTIAFFGGILSLLSPCILPFLPAFFAFAFKEKREITKMTLVFFFGFSIVFISMGITASYVGQLLNQYKNYLTPLAGLFLIVFGFMSLFGIGFSGFLFNKKAKNDIAGIFLMGITFAIGWAPCIGPILGGILVLASMTQNIYTSALLLFFYAVGILLPLFLISILYDRYNLSQSKWIKGRALKFRLFNRTVKVHSTNLVSGFLLILSGAVFIIYAGTSIINNLDLLGTKELFYTYQRQLMEIKL